MNIRYKYFLQVTTKSNPEHMERIIHRNQVGFIPEITTCLSIDKSKNILNHINKMKNKNHFKMHGNHLIQFDTSS